MKRARFSETTDSSSSFIFEKFKSLSGDKAKITSADICGPTKAEIPKDQAATGLEEETCQGTELNDSTPPKPSKRRSVEVGKKIAQAFREEVLSRGGEDLANHDEHKNDESEGAQTAEDYSKFRVPKSIAAIAIDDSKLQRKLLGKFLEFAGIAANQRTVVGDGRDEIMGKLHIRSRKLTSTFQLSS